MTTNSPLREYREKTGISQGELGKMIGVDKCTISRWESARVPAERVPLVARKTNIDPAVIRPDLFSVTGAA